MYKSKRIKKRNTIVTIVVVIVLIVLLTISLLLPRSKNTILKDIAIQIQKITTYPFTALNKEKNKDQSESYLIQKNVNSSLEKEIQELKEALELNKTLTEYNPINATILSRNRSYWFNTMTIDKGSSSGIKKDMAVITKNGLIGKISSVSKTSSEVKLITSDDINFKVSITIKVNDKDNYAILNGYNSKKGLITATGIDKSTKINKGDIVLTSGLGGLFPAGIYVGEVEEMESDKYNLSKNVYIKTQQSFNDIHYVTVLQVKE